MKNLPKLPQGCFLKPLPTYVDSRGSLVELFRQSDLSDFKIQQTNFVESHAGVIRGVHVHLERYDYLTLLTGHVVFGLKDLRADSETQGLSAMVTVTGAERQALIVPPGVAHGFCFVQESLLVYGLSSCWSQTKDEFGCRFDDPGLELKWPVTDPILSERDRNAGTLAEMMLELESVRRVSASSSQMAV